MEQGTEQFTVFEYHRARMTRVGKVLIHPGPNKLKTDVVRSLKHHHYWKHMVETGQITFKTGRVPDNETIPDITPEVPEDLSNVTVKNAVELIKNVQDKDTLDHWLTVETEDGGKGRKGVIEELEAKLDKHDDDDGDQTDERDDADNGEGSQD